MRFIFSGAPGAWFIRRLCSVRNPSQKSQGGTCNRKLLVSVKLANPFDKLVPLGSPVHIWPSGMHGSDAKSLCYAIRPKISHSPRLENLTPFADNKRAD